MKYTVHSNFLEPPFCRYLIGILKKEKNPVQWDDGVIFTRLYNQAENHDTIKILFQRMTRFGIEKFGSNYYIQDIQVVRRSNIGMIMHKDIERHDHSVMCFLNDDYEGGQSIVEDEYIQPEVGKAVVLEGNKVLHGVNDTRGDRYMLLCWWTKV